MVEEAIFIVPYDPTWPEKFEKEKKLIDQTIGQYITGGIHHIGSTSIEGLSAKPVIDILVGVESLDKSRPAIKLLEKIGYCYFPYKPQYEHWFCKPSPEHRTHHLHLMHTNSPEYKAPIAFRNYLRSHPKERQEYEDLKLNLAKKHRHDREAYTDAKLEFVKKIVKKALGTDFKFEE